MNKILSGINDLDNLIDSLYVGDNVVWEVEAGTSFEIFVKNFIRHSFSESQNVIYVSFNKSPNTILQQIAEVPSTKNFVLLDCFTSGKGKNDRTFTKFYETQKFTNVVKVDSPGDIAHFTKVLNSIEDNLPSKTRYIFDSLTGMQDLWGDENRTYKFFTYICPRLYDLGTVAYWILEKEAHSQAFKANLRHITQVVLELYKRKDKLYIKALKLEGRQSREAFKPHPYEIDGRSISITPIKKEPYFDIGTKIKEQRINIGMSQKELAEKVNLTPSFISQLESNQISPSLNSFIQICNALGITPAAILEEKIYEDVKWLIKKEKIFSTLSLHENGLKGYRIVKNGDMSGTLVVLEPYTKIERNFIPDEGKKLIYVLKGDVSVVIDGKAKTLRSGDSVYLKEEGPSLWKNEGGEKAELLLLCS
jgi:transcriptional regulator with XRE-family HTH domain/KaiC/GvpD/RAD55 family RecA-like ATPase